MSDTYQCPKCGKYLPEGYCHSCGCPVDPIGSFQETSFSEYITEEDYEE